MCFPCLGGGRGEKGRGREARRRRGEAKGEGVLMNCDAPPGEGGIRLANHNA